LPLEWLIFAVFNEDFNFEDKPHCTANFQKTANGKKRRR